MLNFKPAFTAENGDFEGCFGLSTAPNTWISPLYKDQGHRGNTARLRDWTKHKDLSCWYSVQHIQKVIVGAKAAPRTTPNRLTIITKPLRAGCFLTSSPNTLSQATYLAPRPLTPKRTALDLLRVMARGICGTLSPSVSRPPSLSFGV